MKMQRLSIMLFCLLPIAALMYGCGSSNKSGGTLSSVASVGDTACYQCHASTADPLTGETFITQYQRSLHAEIGCESCHGGGAQHNGIGPFPYTLNSEVSDAEKAVRCAQCHDGATTFNGKVAPLSSSPNFSNGNHGNPFSAEEAKEAKCARCHSHEGAILYGKEGFTGDASILNNTAFQPVLARDPETFNTIKCATCHEHGGNLRQTKTRDVAGNIVTWDPNNNKVTDQFDLCTSCHNVNTNEGKLIGSGAVLQVYSSAAAGSGFKNITTAAYYHSTRWFRTLPSTHYDQPASRTTASGTTIEGYVIRKNTKNPCYDCHGHEFQTNTRRLDPAASASVLARPNTVFLDWAQSAHAGKMLTAKIEAATGLSGTAQVDAVMKAGATDETGIAWTHYNWDSTLKADGTADRGDCQRCHTSTGAANYLTAPATYNFNNNSFSHLSGWNKTGGSPQQEVLYCWSCHNNAGKGTLRAPGAITANYGSGATASSYSYPDAKGSNVCISCHSGRETGDTIKLATTGFDNKSFVNSHYLTAGGTVFGNTGYHYTGRDYSIPASDTHVKIGLGTTGNAAVDATAKNGPCAGCHFGSKDGSHTLKPVTKYSATDTSLNPLCVNCHDTRGEGTNAYVTWLGDDATAATFTGTTHRARYQAGLEALRALLESKGYPFTSGYPYFAAKNWLSTGDTDTTGATTGKNNMGAAFNYNLLIHDPGGVAHNRRYTRRLIYDAMDWLDDGILNYTVSTTLNALPADTIYKASAIAYLINAGTNNANLATAAERY